MECLDYLLSFYVLLLIQNSILMIGDGFQYYVRHVWGFPNVDQIWNFGPSIYYRNTLENTRNQKSFRINHSCNSEDLKSWKVCKMHVSHFVKSWNSTFCFLLKFCNFEFRDVLKFWTFETCIFETLKFLDFETLGFLFFEILKFETLELWNEETKKPRNH